MRHKLQQFTKKAILFLFLFLCCLPLWLIPQSVGAASLLGRDKVSMFDIQSPCKETQAGFKQTPGEAVDKLFGI